MGALSSSMAQRDMAGSRVLESSIKGTGKGINVIWALKWHRLRAISVQCNMKGGAKVIPIYTMPCRAGLINAMGLKCDSIL